ncbi:MAG: (Fe-S)-binding protein [Clostridium chrysemydis]|uniref:(Fe-S)-binding protein n=1 Tax=Clostridium chrysemydis TaxID=2665504 RepID=UPI003F3CA60A
MRKVSDNLKKCINCNRCYKVCPMMKEFSDSPKDLMNDILNSKINTKDVSYSCMLCNSCTEVCIKDLDLKDMFLSLREDIYKEGKDLKKYNLKSVKTHQKISFSKITKNKIKNKSTKKVFIPGCSLSSYNNKIIKNTLDYLKKEEGETLELLIRCCGKPSKDIGDIKSYKENLENLNKELKENNIEEVIVACANCYNTFKDGLKGIKVSSLWNILWDKGLDSNLKDKYKDFKCVALHDPCPMKKEKKIQDDVRSILKFLGLNVIEFKKNRENTVCCGAGGMVLVTNNKLFLKQSKKRANEAECDTIVSYCASCVNTLKTENKKTLHILDFLFNKDVLNRKTTDFKKVSSIEGFKNRITLNLKSKRWD